MMSNHTVKVALAGGAAGLFFALMATASPAGADPVDPAGPPAPPAPVVSAPASTAAATAQSAGTEAAPPPPEGVPHLASPDALPPGSTLDPTVMGRESPNVSYLKDLWHAVQNQDISGKEALLLGISQRGMNTPYPKQAPGPNVPISGADAVPAPQPASALPPPAEPSPPTP